MPYRFFLAVICLLFIQANAFAAESFRVGTKSAAIRESCRFFSPARIPVKYNDELTLIAQDGDWFRVRFKGTEGCIHKSSVQVKKVEHTGTAASSEEKHSASEAEVALAGKGFTPEIEKEYQTQNPEIKFELVNAVELNIVNMAELKNFMEKGGLRLPE